MDLEELLGLDMSDPAVREAVRRLDRAMRGAVERVCVHGCCVELVLLDGRVVDGWGPAGCPCCDEEHDDLGDLL